MERLLQAQHPGCRRGSAPSLPTTKTRAPAATDATCFTTWATAATGVKYCNNMTTTHSRPKPRHCAGRSPRERRDLRAKMSLRSSPAVDAAKAALAAVFAAAERMDVDEMRRLLDAGARVWHRIDRQMLSKRVASGLLPPVQGWRDDGADRQQAAALKLLAVVGAAAARMRQRLRPRRRGILAESGRGRAQRAPAWGHLPAHDVLRCCDAPPHRGRCGCECCDAHAVSRRTAAHRAFKLPPQQSGVPRQAACPCGFWCRRQHARCRWVHPPADRAGRPAHDTGRRQQGKHDGGDGAASAAGGRGSDTPWARRPHAPRCVGGPAEGFLGDGERTAAGLSGGRAGCRLPASSAGHHAGGNARCSLVAPPAPAAGAAAARQALRRQWRQRRHSSYGCRIGHRGARIAMTPHCRVVHSSACQSTRASRGISAPVR